MHAYDIKFAYSMIAMKSQKVLLLHSDAKMAAKLFDFEALTSGIKAVYGQFKSSHLSLTCKDHFLPKKL